MLRKRQPDECEYVISQIAIDEMFVYNKAISKSFSGDAFYADLKAHLLSPPFSLLYSIARTGQRTSRSRVLMDGDCFRILSENGKILQCAGESCSHKYMTVWEKDCYTCDNCGLYFHEECKNVHMSCMVRESDEDVLDDEDVSNQHLPSSEVDVGQDDRKEVAGAGSVKRKRRKRKSINMPKKKYRNQK